jgi:hypothetical protein
MAANGVTVHEVGAGPFFEATGSVRERFGKGPLGDYMRRIAETTTP